MSKLRGETAELRHLDQIPQGMSEDETDAFWETHSLGDELLDQMERFPDDFSLPPREENRESREEAASRSSGTVPTGKIVLGVVAVGLLAAGCYVAYRPIRSGNATAFVPTRYPNLRAFRRVA